jgi:hypothetical protein
LAFEANRGQTDPRVDFVARGTQHTLFLAANEAVLVLTTRDSTGIVMRMAVVGANRRPRVVGLDELPGKANYFVGKDPAKWHTNVPLYARVQYAEVYPGIDLAYTGDQRQMAYAFAVRPGADPRRIVLHWSGADSLAVDAEGALALYTAQGVIRQPPPVILEEHDGAGRKVAGRYVRHAGDQVGFAVAAPDASPPLVITGTVPLLVIPTPHSMNAMR